MRFTSVRFDGKIKFFIAKLLSKKVTKVLKKTKTKLIVRWLLNLAEGCTINRECRCTHSFKDVNLFIGCSNLNLVNK